jgi:hypothetical protein
MKKSILILILVCINSLVQASNSLNIFINARTCKNCLVYLSDVKKIDTNITVNLIFNSILTEEQINQFIVEKFPATFKNYQVKTNDSLFKFFMDSVPEELQFGVVAIINESNKVLSFFSITAISENIEQVNWLCKNKKLHVTKNSIEEFKNDIEVFNISESNRYLIISSFEKIIIYDTSKNVLRRISFKNDSMIKYFFNRVNKQSKLWTTYSQYFKKVKNHNYYQFLATSLIDDKLFFTFTFDSFYVENDIANTPPVFFLGEFDIEKNKFEFTPINRHERKDFYVSPNYFKKINNNEIILFVSHLKRGEGKKTLALYTQINGRYVFNKYLDIKLNTTSNKFDVGYPYNLFINSNFLVHYESLTFYDLKNSKSIKLKNQYLKNIDESLMKIIHCDKSQNTLRLISIKNNYLIEHFFNQLGQEFFSREYELGQGNFQPMSNSVSLDNQVTFLNEKNELVVLKLEPVTE